MRVVAFGATDPGRRRSRNEDAFGILAEEGVLVVADGMGGHRGGSVASKMAVDAVVAAFTEARGDHAGALDRMRGERSRLGTTEPMEAIGSGSSSGSGGGSSGGGRSGRSRRSSTVGRATTEPARAKTDPALAKTDPELAVLKLDKSAVGGPAAAASSAAAAAAAAASAAAAAAGVGRGGAARRITLADREDTPPVSSADSGVQFAYSAALTLLQVSMRQAAAAIFSVGREELELHGMGTTLTAAVLEDDRLHVAHVGDSRCYLWRQGELRQLTEDHSWIAEQVRVGALTEKEAKQSRFRHVITRSIGVERHADIEVRSVAVVEGDRLLLCSDGLFGLVPDAELAELMGAEELAELPARLIALANARGGDDNITAVVARLVAE